MNRYLTLTIMAAILAVVAFFIIGNELPPSRCRNNQDHRFTRWESTNHKAGFFGTKVVMKKRCLTCGQIRTKASE